LPTPVSDEPTSNFSAEDEKAWDERLANKGSKGILNARKRFWIKEFLKGSKIPDKPDSDLPKN
jgi:hypothetical protein